MRRLSYILIAITLGFTPNRSQARDALYSVAGDVSTPQSYRYPGRQHVYLRDLLNDAGYHNAAGIARILRGTPLKTVTTDCVDPDMTGSGSLLFPGDVVVFRSYDGHCPGRQNALVMFSDGPVLLEIPGTGYPVWRLFEVTQMPHDGRISVARTRQGSASEVWMSRHAFIQHGDVINLGVITQSAGLRISPVYQTASDIGKEHLSGIQMAQYSNDATGHSAPSHGGAQQPALLKKSFDTFNAKTSDEFFSHTDAGQMLLQTSNTVQTEDNAADNPFRMASLPAPSRVPASPAVAGRQNETGNNAWNALFLTGLAVAAGLILFGWLKTKREQAGIHQVDDGLHGSRFAAADDRTDTAAAERLEVPAASEPNSQTRGRAVELSEPTVGSAVSVISGNCPVLSAGIDEYDTEDLETIDAASPSPASETDSADDIVESHENGTVEAADAEIQANEPFENQRLNEGSKAPHQVVSESGDAVCGEQASNIEAVTAAKAVSPRQEAFSDLEDLLQNRLPIDVKKSDLPLRITLFGKPAGPCRLRIDAAHTETAPPHMMTSARQKQNSKPAATTATVSLRDRAGIQPADVAATNADHERFDHALDFLEGQSDS